MNKTQLCSVMIFALLFCVVAYSTNAQIPGTLDSTFNSVGFATNVLTPGAALGSNGTSVAIQSDGKIVAAGVSMNNNLLLVRYNSNGTIDNNFGVNGIVETDFGSIEEVGDIVLQPDGKIVVGGRYGPIPDPAMLVTRFNTNGTVDASFGANGYTVIDYTNRRENIRSIALASDGSIVGIGETSPSVGIDSFVMMVVKLRPNGLPDSTFSGDGIALLPHTEDSYGFSVLVQPDGKVIAGGYLLSPLSSSNVMQMVVARFNTAGLLDGTFGTGGVAKIHFGAFDDESLGYSLALQNDGKILIGGDNRRPAQGIGTQIALARLNANGIPDMNFGINGQVLTSWGNNMLVHCGSIALQSDGSIVAAGYSADVLTNITYIALTRYNTNGTIDNSFSGNGKLNSLVSLSDRARKVAIQVDGKIVIVGHSYDGSTYYTTLARYHSGVTTGIMQQTEPLRDLLAYPNRVDASSILQYTMLSAGKVDIRVIDMKGIVVRYLVRDERQGTGMHTISLAQLKSLPAGMYTLHVAAGREAGSVKVVVD